MTEISGLPEASAGHGGEDGPEPASALEERRRAGQAEEQRPLEFLGAIEVQVAVELGRASLTIGEVLRLGPGSVVPLDSMLGDPARLVVKGRVIARGEVVVVDDRFGLRITEVVPRERA